MEQISSVLAILQSDAVMSTLDTLYWDEARGDRRKGAFSKADRPGSIRRFKRFLNQIQRTYDLETMSASDLLAMLPKEFDSFRATQALEVV
jgi:hypothetical protein